MQILLPLLTFDIMTAPNLWPAIIGVASVLAYDLVVTVVNATRRQAARSDAEGRRDYGRPIEDD